MHICCMAQAVASKTFGSVVIESVLMDEGAQRIESYFERARVREETGSGAATSSGFGTNATDSQTAKRKGDDETNEMDERSKKR